MAGAQRGDSPNGLLRGCRVRGRWDHAEAVRLGSGCRGGVQGFSLGWSWMSTWSIWKQRRSGMGKKGRLERAQSLHVRGRLAEAEAIYREVLQVQPDQVEALEGLGALTFHLGRSEEARAFFAQGVAIA